MCTALHEVSVCTCIPVGALHEVLVCTHVPVGTLHEVLVCPMGAPLEFPAGVPRSRQHPKHR